MSSFLHRARQVLQSGTASALSSCRALWSGILRSVRHLLSGTSPQFQLVLGFALLVALGWGLLCLPFSQRSPVGALDALFMATSAVSTTGLVTVDLAQRFTVFGLGVVLLLFQLGGIGYMTLISYLLFRTSTRLSEWQLRLIGAEYDVPKTFKPADFVRAALLFSAAMEVLGCIGFGALFHQSGYRGWTLIGQSIFHSVSAYCTAGFSLLPNGFVAFRDVPAANLLVAALALAGSLGFITVTDIAYRLRGQTRALSFTTQIVVVGMLILLTGGTLLFALTEPALDAGQSRWWPAFFQVMSAMTTVGFNTVDLAGFGLPILLITIFLMYVGASPAGTSGGLKITTLTAMLAVLKSRLLGHRRITFLGRRIPFERLYVATASFGLYTSLIFAATFLLSLTETAALEDMLFEVCSALGTVGLSTGLTPQLSPAGKYCLIALMFVGRMGILTFGLALLVRTPTEEQGSEAELDDLVVS